MKCKCFYLFLFFLANNFMLLAQVTRNNTKSNALLPLKIGDYWVYSSSQSPAKYDTVMITQKKIIGSDTAYYFNSALMMIKNDTVFEFQPQRNGIEKASVQYFSSETEVNYRILVGGDAWAGRSVRKLKEPYKIKGKEYTNCYEFKDMLYNKVTVFSKGIGIIEMKYPDQIISLVDYKIH
jgi:hypothetical protein